MQIDLKDLLNLQRIKITHAIQDAVIGNKEPVLALNDAQLDKGQDSQGKSLGKYANFKYKNRFKPVDLKKTGEFRSEEDIIADDNQMLFINTNEKTPKLINKYGKDILGLNEANKGRAAKILTPYVVNELKDQIS